MSTTIKIDSFQSAKANVNGINLHYWIGVDPNGLPVLPWHGFLGTGYSWYKVMRLLAKSGYSVLVPDMRGYGDSDKPAGVDGYDGRALAGEFRSLTKHIGFGSGRPLFLVAHDMGAPPALLWASDHPDEVAGVIYAEAPVMLPACSGEDHCLCTATDGPRKHVVVDPSARAWRSGNPDRWERARVSKLVLPGTGSRQGRRYLARFRTRVSAHLFREGLPTRLQAKSNGSALFFRFGKAPLPTRQGAENSKASQVRFQLWWFSLKWRERALR